MDKAKNNKIRLKSFLASAVATFIVLSLVHTAMAFFSDIQKAKEAEALMAASLNISVSDFQIKDGTGDWGTESLDWEPYGVSEIHFTVENTGYDDVILTDTLKMSWDDTILDPSVLVLYPASMSDAEIVADITSASPTSAIFGTVDSESDQPSITFELDDGRLNGDQSSEAPTDKTKTITYKLVFNHDTDISYEGKTISIELEALANYWHNPDIAWNSFKDDFEPLTIMTATSTGNLFKVVFDGNGGSGAPSTMQYHSGDSIHTFSVPTATMTYDLSHIFAGWADTSTATSASYRSGDSITVNPGTTTLYAVWINPFTIAYEDAGKTMSGDYYIMQDMTTAICDAVTTPTILTDAPAIQLKDVRDNKTYWVSKLADGKCWMTQNLDFDLSTKTTLSNTTSDLNSVSSWTPSNNTTNASDNATTTGRSASISWRGSSSKDISFDVGNVYYIFNPAANATCPDNGYLQTTCNDIFSSTPPADKGEHGHVGNYYTFPAAVAHNSVRSNQVYTDSICPAHWRLAYSTDSDDYATLASAYGANGYDDPLLEAPVYLVRGGYLNNDKLSNAGDTGQLWTAKITNNTNNKTVGFQHTASSAETNANLSPGNGATVRCIAR